jgi:hypothetical protein
MEKASCIIIGCAKNVAPSLPKTLEKIEAIRALWSVSAVVIAENGSTDGTKRLLEAYQSKPNTHVLTLDTSANTIVSRTERLAFLRNTLMEFVHTTYPSYDYILNVDMDGVLDGLDPTSLAFAFKPSMPAWDALFANVRGAYYDIWALRAKALELEFDCWDMVRHCMIQFGMNRAQAKQAFVTKHQINIPFNPRTLIPVESAFGGLGLYRLSATKGCRYVGLTDTCSCRSVIDFGAMPCAPEVCEHVAFHRDMIAKGSNLFIHSQILVKTQQEHL